MITPDTSLRRIYAEVCRGYSRLDRAAQPVYVKHLTVFDQTEIDSLREVSFDRAAKRGVKTEADKLKWLADKGLWVKKDDVELAAQQSYVDNLEKTRSKLAYKSQIEQMDKQLSEARGKLAEGSNKRARFIGLTAEQVADQRVQYEYIRLSFYHDSELRHPIYSSDDIGNLTDEETDNLLFDYINVSTRFSPDNLRRIVIAPFFTNQFYLCGDDIPSFFGRPMVSLSIYQTNLLSYGQYFKSIMTSNDIPKELTNNPDKIEEYVMRSRNLKTMVGKTAANADRVALIGATSEDFKAMGVEDGSAKVREDIGRQVRSGIQAAKTREVTQNPR